MILFHSSFDLAAPDASVAVIYGGIQFRNSVTEGLSAGQAVGSQSAACYFQPSRIPGPSGTALLPAAVAGRFHAPPPELSGRFQQETAD